MLSIRKLSTGYGKLQILRGIDLTVPDGKIVALLGGNGTGKSTLLKAISGLIQVWDGEVTFGGERIDNAKPNEIVRRGLIQVTQGKDAFPAMTVDENLLLGAYCRADRRSTREDLERTYTFFPVLKQRRRQLAATLSVGEVQMLVIGRGLMARPKMILLDEPSAALAPRLVLDTFGIIHRISRLGVTILIVEQNVRMALLLAEYAYVILDGTIQIEGGADQLMHDDRVRLAYLGGTVAGTEPPIY